MSAHAYMTGNAKITEFILRMSTAFPALRTIPGIAQVAHLYVNTLNPLWCRLGFYHLMRRSRKTNCHNLKLQTVFHDSYFFFFLSSLFPCLFSCITEAPFLIPLFEYAFWCTLFEYLLDTLLENFVIICFDIHKAPWELWSHSATSYSADKGHFCNYHLFFSFAVLLC